MGTTGQDRPSQREDHTADGAGPHPGRAEHEVSLADGARQAMLADVPLGEIRAELRELLTLADTSVKPLPDRPIPETHPFAPGWEWRIDYRNHDQVDPARSFWSVLVREPDEVSAVVYVHGPDSMPGDYMACPTTEARALAMAILAACDRADAQASGLPNLADRRRNKTPQGGSR